VQSHQRAAEATKPASSRTRSSRSPASSASTRSPPGVVRRRGHPRRLHLEGSPSSAPSSEGRHGHRGQRLADLRRRRGRVVASSPRPSSSGHQAHRQDRRYHTSGVAPKDIFAAPSPASGVLKKAGLNVSDIDLFEINEAFAAQVLCNIKALNDIPESKLNVCGGGIALGHPIGGSGARVLTTLIHQLHRTGGKRGVAALCLGGGNAVAMVVDRGESNLFVR
jgi:acetyl-CoA acetyltransferase